MCRKWRRIGRGFARLINDLSTCRVASLPHELQPKFYRYGVAMPFYNVGRVVRTVSPLRPHAKQN